MIEKHVPVLLNEVIESLDIKEDGIYLDLTLGRGGHSEEILKRLSNKGLLIGVDQDETAIKESEERLSKLKDKNFKIVRDNFSNVSKILKDFNIKEVNGVLMDLGVSSPQFDDVNRGFSYRFDAPLDMRMDQRTRLTAKDVVNNYSVEELSKILRDYGDEKYAYQIAKNIVKYRKNKEIETTFELVEIVKASKPAKELKKVGHPAKQVFQAIRIAVNDELNVLTKALEDVTSSLASKGRLAVITFHSGEDKIVKQIFKRLTVVEGNRINLPNQIEEAEFIQVNRKVIVPSDEEIANNHRAISAKLRVIERK